MMSNTEGEQLIENMARAMAGEELVDNTGDYVSPSPRKIEPAVSAMPDGLKTKYEQPVKLTALQQIAKSMTQLTWREAESMGRSIEEKIKSKGGQGSPTLTGALQDWAWTWQTFKEEEQPK